MKDSDKPEMNFKTSFYWIFYYFLIRDTIVTVFLKFIYINYLNNTGLLLNNNQYSLLPMDVSLIDTYTPATPCLGVSVVLVLQFAP